MPNATAASGNSISTAAVEAFSFPGSYQGRAYQALSEANLHPNWVAGISIGAINAALSAGNPPEKRVEKLRQFWETVTTPPFDLAYASSVPIHDPATHRFVNQTRAFGIMLLGARDFFKPRLPISYCLPARRPETVRLETLVDFDLINTGNMRRDGDGFIGGGGHHHAAEHN
jgi:NTE family protein